MDVLICFKELHVKHLQNYLSENNVNQANTDQRVFARKLSRQLSKAELPQVAGAGNGTKTCWDTGGFMEDSLLL